MTLIAFIVTDTTVISIHFQNIFLTRSEMVSLLSTSSLQTLVTSNLLPPSMSWPLMDIMAFGISLTSFSIIFSKLSRPCGIHLNIILFYFWFLKTGFLYVTVLAVLELL